MGCKPVRNKEIDCLWLLDIANPESCTILSFCFICHYSLSFPVI